MEYSEIHRDEGGSRIRRIQEHPRFRELCAALCEAEAERPFCRHTTAHFLDVARLMYIYCLEDGADLEKDVIYAAALLHDLGRREQQLSGTPHEEAGARIAGDILADCGFSEAEIRSVQRAILGHRREAQAGDDRFAAYLYRADKGSRNCAACSARAECSWPDEKKNLWMEY
ncbi:MAG: HD domain-containing protein [Lachnospiraceae bacterium]|nr:HD domain-containing protein [Lachnospiraceae bacterium]